MLAGLILVRRSFGCMKNSSPGTHHSAVPGGYMDWTAYSMQSTQNKAVLQVWFFFIYEKKSRPHVPFPIALHKHTSPWWGGGDIRESEKGVPFNAVQIWPCVLLWEVNGSAPREETATVKIQIYSMISNSFVFMSLLLPSFICLWFPRKAL